MRLNQASPRAHAAKAIVVLGTAMALGTSNAQALSIPVVLEDAASASASVGGVDVGGGTTLGDFMTALSDPALSDLVAFTSTFPAAGPRQLIVGSARLDLSGLCAGGVIGSSGRLLLTVTTTGDDIDDLTSANDGLHAFVTSDGTSTVVPQIEGIEGPVDGALSLILGNAVARGYRAAFGTVAVDTNPDTGEIHFSVPYANLAELQAMRIALIAESVAGSNDGTSTVAIQGVSASIVDSAVTCPNLPPVARDDSGSTTGGMGLDLSVLGNDSDPEGSALSVVAVDGQPVSVGQTITLSGDRGTVLLNATGSLTFRPPAGFVGTASFTYQVSDGTASSTATARVTVAAEPVAPPVVSPPVVLPNPLVETPTTTRQPVLRLSLQASSPRIRQGSELVLTVRTTATRADASEVESCVTVPAGFTVVRRSRSDVEVRGRRACRGHGLLKTGKSASFKIVVRATGSNRGRSLVRATTTGSNVKSVRANQGVAVVGQPQTAPRSFTG